MRVLSVYGGIGSMLIPAKENNLEILGNYEPRGPFKVGDFYKKNFNQDYLSYEQTMQLKNIDLIVGHPSCGSFSNLSRVKNIKPIEKEDLYKTLQIVAELKPKHFLIENLIKSLSKITPEIWMQQTLNLYDINYQVVSCFNYGNTQKGRVRVYVTGSLKSEPKFNFIPQEIEQGPLLNEILSPNDYIYQQKQAKQKVTNLIESGETWEDLSKYLLSIKEGEMIKYNSPSGGVKRRIGCRRLIGNRPGATLSGANGFQFHPFSGYPLSFEDRKKIQGYPKWFDVTTSPKHWDLSTAPIKNLARQFSKALPYEPLKEFYNQFVNGNSNLEPIIYYTKKHELIENANKI